MLKQLYIKNFTLIDELDIPLYPGFSVITGETGAGKSIILRPSDCSWATVQTARPSRQEETDA